MAGSRKTSRGQDRRELGQSLVEFAFVLPVFLVIVMATIDFGFAFQRYIVLTNAAREGARVAVIDGATPAGTEEAVRVRLGGHLSGQSDVSVSPSPLGVSGTEVSVQVSYTYEFLTPLGSLIRLATGPDGIELSSTTTMRRE